MPVNTFAKLHGLGNDYIVFDEETIRFSLTENAIRRICDVHYGVGSDGILLKTASGQADFGLRIFNPDGSEAEKSGNGLRIFSKYLYDYGFAGAREFTVETKGGVARANIFEIKNGKASYVAVDMGQAVFKASDIPVTLDKDEVVDVTLTTLDREFKVNCVSVGNPHCMILTDTLDIATVKKYGAAIENHPIFPNRINVQFVKPVHKREAEMLIWERGAGYTLASGSSASAVAAMLYKLGLAASPVTIKMPGGELVIDISEDYGILMTGEVRHIADGVLGDELIADFVLGLPE